MTTLLPRECERHARRKPPQHADEADEQQSRLQQANAEIGGDLGELPRVVVNALVGVDADFAHTRDTEAAMRFQPLKKQVPRQPFAQFQLGHLSQPSLSDVENQQCAGDIGKNQKLLANPGEVLSRQRVVEGLIPRV